MVFCPSDPHITLERTRALEPGLLDPCSCGWASATPATVQRVTCVCTFLGRGPVAFTSLKGVCGLPELGAKGFLKIFPRSFIMQCLLCARHYSKHFPYISSFRLNTFPEFTHLVSLRTRIGTQAVRPQSPC